MAASLNDPDTRLLKTIADFDRAFSQDRGSEMGDFFSKKNRLM